MGAQTKIPSWEGYGRFPGKQSDYACYILSHEAYIVLYLPCKQRSLFDLPRKARKRKRPLLAG